VSRDSLVRCVSEGKGLAFGRPKRPGNKPGEKEAPPMVEQSTAERFGSSLLPELLGKPDENSFAAPDVAEPIHIFVLDHFADELRAAFAEPSERIVDVLHGEHDA
jgi:hypothetical protein